VKTGPIFLTKRFKQGINQNAAELIENSEILEITTLEQMKIIDHLVVRGRRRLQSDRVLSKPPSTHPSAFSRSMVSGLASDANFGPTDYDADAVSRRHPSFPSNSTWAHINPD